MRNLVISSFIILALACSSQSLEAIMISQENGMTVLANFTNSSGNQSSINATINQTQDNQTSTQNNQTSAQDNLTQAGNGNNAKSGLWDWGKIPLGYELNENGTLTRVVGEQWEPSI